MILGNVPMEETMSPNATSSTNAVMPLEYKSWADILCPSNSDEAIVWDTIGSDSVTGNVHIYNDCLFERAARSTDRYYSPQKQDEERDYAIDEKAFKNLL